MCIVEEISDNGVWPAVICSSQFSLFLLTGCIYFLPVCFSCLQSKYTV